MLCLSTTNFTNQTSLLHYCYSRNCLLHRLLDIGTPIHIYLNIIRVTTHLSLSLLQTLSGIGAATIILKLSLTFSLSSSLSNPQQHILLLLKLPFIHSNSCSLSLSLSLSLSHTHTHIPTSPILISHRLFLSLLHLHSLSLSLSLNFCLYFSFSNLSSLLNREGCWSTSSLHLTVSGCKPNFNGTPCGWTRLTKINGKIIILDFEMVLPGDCFVYFLAS